MLTKKKQKEALHYDLSSLILLQDKHVENVAIFEGCIRKERETIIFEKTVIASLEERLQLHKSKVVRLKDEDVQAIVRDVPRLKDLIAKCDENINNMQNAILEEQEQMDLEAQMISFLERSHVSKE